MVEKKTRTKIPLYNKVKAELQQEINSSCPFCKSKDVGHFEIHHIDENPSNNQSLNLILVCPTCHSKITKGDWTPLEVMQMKISLLPKPGEPLLDKISVSGKVINSAIGNNNIVNIKNTISKKIIQKYPSGCIGFDNLMANYVSYLVDRYHKYKESEVGKAAMNYALFPSLLKNRYKIGKSRSIYNLPIEQFDDLISHIQGKINSTLLAKKLGKAHKNFSSFQDYKSKNG